MKKTLIALVALAATACTAPDRSTRVLEDQGYTDVRVTGYAFMDCSEDDTFATAFEATSPAGKPVEGAVCSGLLKGSTIRLD